MPAAYRLPQGQTDDSQGVQRHNDGEYSTHIPNEPSNRDWQEYQVWLEDGNTPDPGEPLPIEYARAVRVDEQVRTTDDVFHEVFRLTGETRHVYRATFSLMAIDAANSTSKESEARMVYKGMANLVQVGSTVVLSNCQDAAASSWAIQAQINGLELIIGVRGAIGRTIDWMLVGDIAVYAPEGLT